MHRPTHVGDCALFGALTRLFVEMRLAFHGERASVGVDGAEITIVQRTSRDLPLYPISHSLFLDGEYLESGNELVWKGLGHLRTRDAHDTLEGLQRSTSLGPEALGFAGARFRSHLAQRC